MADKKVRQFCKLCNQITTQTRANASQAWTCLCCESAKYRASLKSKQTQKGNLGKRKLNLNF